MSRVTTEAGEALGRLRRARKILLTGHRNPDGDCLGAALGLAELAAKLDVEAVIQNRDPAPSGLDELPGAGTVRVGADLPEDFPAAFDLVVTVECPGLDRTGFDGLHAVPILNLDHHKANERYGELNYLDEDSPAAGEMVWRMFTEAPVTPSADAATSLFAALSTDTGDFRYSNATGRAFRAAAEMVEWGARPEVVSELVHGRRREAAVRLLGEALRSLEILADGRLALVQVDPEAFRRAGAAAEDTESIVNVPRSIAGVEAVAFLKSVEPGSVRVSLRSTGDVDVRSVAAGFGGGGHTNAAGCSVDGDVTAARDRLVPELLKLLGAAS
jgi:phosphoesterase RecJ-like protein